MHMSDHNRVNNVRSLVVDFALANVHASYVDKWIVACIKMGAEEIHVKFGGTREQEEELYVFPCHHFWCYPPFLKHLSLALCTLSFPSERTSWLSQLTELDLSHVRLSESVVHSISTEGSNLLSLTLTACPMPKQELLFINGQLQRLKKLSIRRIAVPIKLICPSLEEFNSTGVGHCVTFVDVPILRRVLYQTDYDSSFLFDHFTTNAPKLQALSLYIRQEVRPLLATLARCSLKQLNLRVLGRVGYDLMSLTYLLNASPSLETLNIKVHYCYPPYSSEGRQQREYPEQPHFQLKEVELFGGFQNWNAMELATYILKNAVALEQMILGISDPETRKEMLMKKKTNPTAKLLILEGRQMKRR